MDDDEELGELLERTFDRVSTRWCSRGLRHLWLVRRASSHANGTELLDSILDEGDCQWQWMRLRHLPALSK